MPFRPTSVVVHPDLEDAYSALELAAADAKQPAAAIWKSLQTAVSRIKTDGQWGEVIPRVPAYFREKYRARNLYCVDLASFHRFFYTIRDKDVVFLDLVDHPTYDKLIR